jgi:hypothetical protein
MRDLRPPHPIYAALHAATAESSSILYLAGGGGASRSGVPNTVRRYRDNTPEGILELGANSGAPMCLALHIDGKKTHLAVGINEYCVIYSVSEEGE